MNTPLATASGTTSVTPAVASAGGARPATASAPAGLPTLPRPQADEFDAIIRHGAYMPLTQFGVIDATGEEAASFLHGQLTNDTQ
ncbi:MAG TPA: folate-binding protein, partial [Paraburkholderia sp.]|nr:folate-binding protein [Paraburkholderia sp.]